MVYQRSIFFCRKKTSFERFENSCAKIQFEMHSMKDLPKLAIFEKSSFVYKKNIIFPKNSNFERFEIASAKKNLKSIVKVSIQV